MSPVQLAVLPDFKEHTVVVGTSVRKRADVLKAYLDALAGQELPPQVKLHYVFVPDFAPEQADARELLQRFVAAHEGELLRGVPSGVGDFTDVHPQTHQWSQAAMARVGQNKNRILRRAAELGADGVWLVDADLICDRTTLVSMLALELPITSAVYWTHWHRQGFETRKIHAAPQVWLNHPYQLDGRGYDEAGFREQLVNRQVTKVPGYGACTLISRRAIEGGVSFDYLPDVPPVGLMAGEDRHFCIRAERLHIEAFADPWPDIFHVYHLDTDAPQIPVFSEQLGASHKQRPELGDLVSLRLQPLEPVPHVTGWTMVLPQNVRGRLGQIPMMPELEEAIYGLERGKDITVPVHFPVHHPVGYYRGKRRLIRIRLVDCKPFGFAPVIDAEVIVGPRSKKWMDTTTFNDKQEAGIREVAGV